MAETFDLVAPLLAPRRAASRLRLAGALQDNKERIAAAWVQLVAEQELAIHPDLERQLRAMLSGLCEVFSDGDWTLAQTIVDGLAERRGRVPGSSDHGFQRALISGRHAISPFISEEIEDRELMLETLHECVFRYYESYQGVRLASENERMHTRIIRSLVMALEARDPYTKGHSISVALLCEKLAQLLDIDSHQAYLAGLLHDVGKVGIPDSILSKDGPLSEEEWVIMRAHPVISANILSPIKLYVDVVEGVLSHHENWDGSGYPTGLQGEEIPMLGRVIRVVDSFDAMTSTRAFRASRSVTDTLIELDELSDMSYDKSVVEALRRLVDTPGTMRDLSLASLSIDLSAGRQS